MKLSESYIFGIESDMCKLKKSLGDLKESDFLQPETIQREVNEIVRYYSSRNIVPVAYEIQELVAKKIVRFLSPDRENFMSALPASIPSVITRDPKTGKPIVVIEGAQSVRVLINKSKASDMTEYDIINRVNLFNQTLSASLMFVLNKKPLPLTGSSANAMREAGVTLYLILMRRVYEGIFNLGTTKGGNKLNNLLYITAIWALANVFDDDDHERIESVALRVTKILSQFAWDTPPGMGSQSNYKKLFGCDFKEFVDVMGEVSMADIKPKLRYIIANVASLYGVGFTTSLEYLPYFASAICSVETGTHMAGFMYKNIKDALKGRKEVEVFKKSIFTHLNKNIDSVMGDR